MPSQNLYCLAVKIVTFDKLRSTSLSLDRSQLLKLEQLSSLPYLLFTTIYLSLDQRIMLLRVRTNVGLWRVDGLDEATATVQDVLDGIAKTRPHVSYQKPLSRDPACNAPLDTSQSLKAQNLGHGSMVHCRVDPETCADITPKEDAGGADAMDIDGGNSNANNNSANMKRVIAQDGSIKLVPSGETRVESEKGFRKGMMPLRDMKMAWTLNEFMALDSQFTFKIQRQASAICNQVSLDTPSIANFQAHLARFQFQRKRFGVLYGKFVEEDGGEADSSSSDKNDDKDKSSSGKKRAIVEAIYEPPQQPDADAAEGFEMLDDPLEENVDKIAELCGLTKVGWIFGHPPNRPEGVVLTAAEVIMAAEYQLEAAGGVEETPFVTLKVTTGEDGNVAVEAFQVSQQCMAMVAEEALEIGEDEAACKVNETFTAIQEGKEAKTVNNNFFLTVVPIVQHTSETFVSQFPRMNRDLDDRMPSHDELKRQLSKSGSSGWTFIDLLSDFNLLIYLSKFLDVNADFPKICQSVVNRDVPLDDGYKIIITSMAGMDGSY